MRSTHRKAMHRYRKDEGLALVILPSGRALTVGTLYHSNTGFFN